MPELCTNAAGLSVRLGLYLLHLYGQDMDIIVMTLVEKCETLLHFHVHAP